MSTENVFKKNILDTYIYPVVASRGVSFSVQVLNKYNSNKHFLHM